MQKMITKLYQTNKRKSPKCKIGDFGRTSVDKSTFSKVLQQIGLINCTQLQKYLMARRQLIT